MRALRRVRDGAGLGRADSFRLLFYIFSATSTALHSAVSLSSRLIPYTLSASIAVCRGFPAQDKLYIILAPNSIRKDAVAVRIGKPKPVVAYVLFRSAM